MEAGTEDHSVVVRIDDRTEQAVARNKCITMALILPDYLSSALVMQTLTASWFFELLQILDTLRYYKPSDLAITTSYPLGIAIFSAIATAVAKAIDYHSPNANAMSHLLTLPSTSVVFFLMQLISNITNYNAISLPVFIVISCAAIPMSAMLFYKFEASDTRKKNDPYYFINTFRTYQPPTYSDFHPDEQPTKVDRIANIMRSAWYCLGTIILFFWAFNREQNSKTIAMAEWQYYATIIFLLASTIPGYLLTEHPKAGQAFVAANKMIESGACIYEALGSLTNLIYIYRCPDYRYCADAQTTTMLSRIQFWLITFPLALFVAANTRFDFKACDETNQKIKRVVSTTKERAQEAGIMMELAATDAKTTYGNAKEKISSMCSTAFSGCGTAFNQSQIALRDCFYSAKKRMMCCHSENNTLDSEVEGLLH